MGFRTIALVLVMLAGFCIVLMLLVNVLSPAPTFEHIPGEVTRYYHNNANPDDDGKPLAQLAAAMIESYQLFGGGGGFPLYQALNILFYALFWPGVMVYLTYWAFGPLSRHAKEADK